jgi:hypothetical protein
VTALLLAEFASADALLEAAWRARRAGLARLDAHTPFPIEGLAEALALPTPPLRPAMLAAGLLGAALAFALCFYSAVFAYPVDSGGRPLNSWPVFLVLRFEGGVLAATLCGVAGFFLATGLPRLHHPAFEAASMARASQDRFFLAVEDARADVTALAALLHGIDTVAIRVVAA